MSGKISDASQLAALAIAQQLADGRKKLTPAERQVFHQQIDAIRQRIIDAAAQRAEREGREAK